MIADSFIRFKKKIMKGKSSTDALVIILKYSVIPEVFPDRQKTGVFRMFNYKQNMFWILRTFKA